MPSQTRILAGAMSGTSADGVDIAIVEISGRGTEMSAKLLHHHHRAYDALLRKRIFQTRDDARVKLADLASLGREISLCHAAAVNEALLLANLRAEDFAAIASHGQTLFHQPPDTIQWLDPALLATETGCAVISDFRRADCAAGGQGAPLVPFADYILFRHPIKNRVLLNIGGIANITYLKAGCSLEDVIAFDTGPGNCISDYLCRRHDPSGPGFDAGGARAMRGKSLGGYFFDNIFNQAFFKADPPKSTDAPLMICAFEEAVRPANDLPLDDLLATAAKLCAMSILNAVTQLNLMPDEWIISGGGTKNDAIMTCLDLAGGFNKRIIRTSELGIPEQAKEAIAFALLGAATLDGMPSNVPSATGAARAVVLGSITPKPTA